MRIYRYKQSAEALAVQMVARGRREDAEALMSASFADPLRYFVPNGKQGEAIATLAGMCEESKTPTLLMTLANGVGKTEIVGQIVCNIVYGPQNGWFNYSIFKFWPFPKKIWYCASSATITETVIPMLDRLLKPGTYKAEKKGKPFISKYIIQGRGGEWQLDLKTYDQDPKTYESDTVGMIIGDEPMPEVLWDACKSRRRMGCVSMLPMTPLYCEPYILDDVATAAEAGRKNYKHIVGDVYEACKKRGTRGHLDPDVIDEMVADYSAEEKEARAYGKAMYYAERIFPSLNREIHYVNPEDYPLHPNHVIAQSIDPHDGRPSAVIWGAKTTGGREIIFAEAPSDNKQMFWDMRDSRSPTEELSEWRGIERRFNIEQYIDRIMDRRFGWQTRGKTNLSTLYTNAAMELRNEKEYPDPYDIAFMPSYRVQTPEGEINYGHKQIRDKLKPMDDGKPGLVIWNTCPHTWNGLTHYKRARPRTDGKAKASGTLVEKYKDFPDAVRGLVCADLGPAIERRRDRVREAQEAEWAIVRGHDVDRMAYLSC